MAAVAVLALSAAAGCVAQAQDQPAPPRRGGDPAIPAAGDRSATRAPESASVQATPSPPDRSSKRVIHVERDERGMTVEVQAEQLGFDHSLQVRRSVAGVPRELRDGDRVTAGDRIRVLVQTSVNAYLYLAFCSQHSFTLYPSQGGIRVQAGVLTAAPLGSGELVIDDEPGTEVLYVILSATDISVADPRLAAALAAQSPGNSRQDCGFFGAPAGPPSPGPAGAPPAPPAPRAQIGGTPTVIRGRWVAKRPLPPRSAPSPHLRSLPVITRPTTPGAAESLPGPGPAPGAPPDPDFVRHPGHVVWYRADDTRGPGATPHAGDPAQVTAADSTGIAVVRYTFNHVPAAR